LILGSAGLLSTIQKQSAKENQEMTKYFGNHKADSTIISNESTINQIENIKPGVKIPERFAPADLVAYLKVLDTNPSTRQQFEARLRFSLNRLHGIQSLDKNDKVTEFGKFLLKVNLPVDFGIMLFESLDKPYLPELTRIVSLISNLTYFRSRNREYSDNYSKMISIYATQNPEIKSDLLFFAELLDLTYRHKHARGVDAIRSANGVTTQAQREQIDNIESELNEYLRSDQLEKAFVLAYKCDMGDLIGVDFDTLEDSLDNESRIMDNLKTEKINYGSDEDFNQESYKKALEEVAICGFASTLMQYSGSNRYGELTYKHLSTGNEVVITKETTIGQDREHYPEFLICADAQYNAKTGKYYGIGIQEVTLPKLKQQYKYTNWVIKEDKPKTSQYDWKTGNITLQTNTVFQDHVNNRNEVIKSEYTNYESTDKPEEAKVAFLEELDRNIESLYPQVKNDEKYFEYLKSLNIVFLGGDKNDGITPKEVYKNRIKKLEILNKTDFDEVLNNGTLELKVDIDDFFNQGQTDQLLEILDQYPQSFDGISLGYTNNFRNSKGSTMSDKICVLFSKSTDLFEKLKLNRDFSLGNNLPIWVSDSNYIEIPIYQAPVLYTIEEYLQITNETKNVEVLKNYSAIHPVKIDQITTVKTLEELFSPVEIGVDALTGEKLFAYLVVSSDSWGRMSLYYSLQRSSDKGYTTALYDQVREVEVNNEIQGNLEQIKSDILDKCNLLKVKAGDFGGTLMDRLNELAEIIQNTTITDKNIAKTITQFETEFALLQRYEYFGDSAIKKVNDMILELQQTYPDQAKYPDSHLLQEVRERRRVLIADIKDEFGTTIASVFLNDKGDKYYSTIEQNSTFMDSLEYTKGVTKLEITNYPFMESQQVIDAKDHKLLMEIAESKVYSNEWVCQSLLVNQAEKYAGFDRLEKFLRQQTNFKPDQLKEIKDFILENGAISFKLDLETVQVAGQYYRELSVIRVQNTDQIEIVPKEKYYFNVNLAVGATDSKIGEKIITDPNNSRIRVALLSGDIKIQKPLPLTKETKAVPYQTVNNVETQPNQDALAALKAKFGQSKSGKKK
jgi:Helicase associated domain (HA2)